MLPVMLLTTVGWVYVVLLMSLSETSFVAGIMTFLLYGVLPLSIILYIFDAPRRRRKREQQERARHEQTTRKSEQGEVAGLDDSGGA
jgi:membrane protein implicated in regulation of membrane protease activity